MQNEIPEEYLQNVGQRPQFINSRCQSGKYVNLALSLQNLKADKALIFTPQELESRFGKWWKNSIKLSMKKLGLKPVLAKKDDKVYLWLRGETSNIKEYK